MREGRERERERERERKDIRSRNPGIVIRESG